MSSSPDLPPEHPPAATERPVGRVRPGTYKRWQPLASTTGAAAGLGAKAAIRARGSFEPMTGDLARGGIHSRRTHPAVAKERRVVPARREATVREIRVLMDSGGRGRW